MSATITLNGSLNFTNTTGPDLTVDVIDKTVTPSSTVVAHHTQSIATSETAINLGGVSSLGYCIIVNRDPTNYVEIKTATSGTIFAKLFPGELAMFRIGSGVTAPYAVANSGAVQIEILLCST